MFVQERKRKRETDTHTSHTHVHMRLVVVPLQGLVLVPETVPWPSISYTLGDMRKSLLSLYHIFIWIPNCTQEVFRYVAVFVPRKGAQRNQVEDLPESQDRAPCGM